MMRRLALLVLSAVCLQAGLPAQAKADDTHAHHVEQLGSVQFANSCRAEAQKDFCAASHFCTHSATRRRAVLPGGGSGRPALRDRAVGDRYDLLPPDLGAARAR